MRSMKSILRNIVRTSQEAHHISATTPNQLMLFGETVAVYCENHTEHTDTLLGQNAEFWCVTVGGTYSNQLRIEGQRFTYFTCHRLDYL
jgi:hypothetical protein